MTEAEQDDTVFQVVVNHRGQHSIWPVERPLPEGWRSISVGSVGGTRAACLAYIEEHWTDLRPSDAR
ncbi:MAG TPA: MbtH family protein [Kofleriaceae bacterium]|nr:MbtH family protein [Kofleriaceae bacterium]